LIGLVALRPGKNNSTRMTRTERTEMLPELIPEIADLKFSRTENDPHRTKLDLNILYLNYFSFQEKLIGQKLADPKLTRTENDPIRTRIESC